MGQTPAVGETEPASLVSGDIKVTETAMEFSRDEEEAERHLPT